MTVSERQALLTPDEVAEMLGVPVSTLRFWRQTKAGPGWVKVGRLVRYPVGELDTWLGQQPSGGAQAVGRRGRRAE